MLPWNISLCVYLLESTPDSHRVIRLNQRTGSLSKVTDFSRCSFALREQDSSVKEPQEELPKDHVNFPPAHGSNCAATPLMTC